MNGKLTSPEKEKPDFKVIIVGGGITGLTLANSLERAHSKGMDSETR